MSKRTLNYYELLNIRPDAGADEIEDAFRKAAEVYGKGSLAVYSLYSPEERKELLEKLTRAYETLRDPERKREYDGILSEADDGLCAEPNGYFEAESEVSAEIIGLRDDIASKTVRFKRPLVVMDSSEQAAAEQYRVLYTRLKQQNAKGACKVIAITSAVKGEGKTATSVNLAYIIAKEFKKKTILVECDLKNPTITASYLTEAGPGLAGVLKGDLSLRDAVSRLESNDCLYFLHAAQSVRNSSELLDSGAMETVIKELKKEFDYLILDCPPILPLADVRILARMVDGLIMVIRNGSTPKDLVRKALGSIHEGRFIGTVLNGADSAFTKYYY